jgi:uncharacterized membrane protein (DUF485 family)
MLHIIQNNMKNIPTYFQWFFKEHIKTKQGMLKIPATLFGIFMAFYVPGPVLEEYWGGWIPIWPVIGIFIAVYGFLIGIILQPIGIYRKLKRMNWWDRINNDFK